MYIKDIKTTKSSQETEIKVSGFESEDRNLKKEKETINDNKCSNFKNAVSNENLEKITNKKKKCFKSSKVA